MIEEIRPESKTDVAPIPFYIYINIYLAILSLPIWMPFFKEFIY